MKRKEKFKFAVGDRVIYRCRGLGGNGILDGKTGVVKHISRYARRHDNDVDYDVEFDEPFPDCMDLAHFRIKPGHGWACTEEHLDKEEIP